MTIYNTYTHSVDIRNQIIEGSRPIIRKKKWWKVIFLQDLLSTFLNSFIIYKKMKNNNHGKYSYSNFLEELLSELVSLANKINFNDVINNNQNKFNHFLT